MCRSLPQISDEQALPQKKHYCQIYQMINFTSGVKCTWKTFRGKTRDLGFILEETGQDYDFTPKEGLKNKSQMVKTASGKLTTPSGSASNHVKKSFNDV
nr:hypothetical protein [Tanacetum cinerariifolium]